MGNFFLQLRRYSKDGSIVKELSDRLSQIAGIIEDSSTSIRKMRVNTDKINYKGGAAEASATLNGADLANSDSDAIANTGYSFNQSIGKGAFVVEDSTSGNVQLWARLERGDSSDSSGNGLTVTPGSSIRLDANGAYFPQDSNSVITVNDNAGIRTSSNFSVTCWIYPTDLNSDGGTNTRLINKADDANNGYSLSMDGTAGSTTGLRASVKQGGVATTKGTASTAITLNAPNHLAFTWDGANIVIYVNGSSISLTSPGAPGLPSSPNLILGRLTSTSGRFKGWLWDARFYNTTLNSTEISNIYKGYSSYDLAGVVNMSDVA